MSRRWAWPALIVALVGLGLLLAYLDSTALRALFPQPFPEPPRPRRLFGGAPGRPEDFRVVRLVPSGTRMYVFGPGPEGLFGLGWFVSAWAVAAILTLAALAALPNRVRVAVERLESRDGLIVSLVAGIAALLLMLALSFVMRITFVLLALLPVLWTLAGLAALFGAAVIAFAAGRRLAGLLGDTHPLLAGLAGALVIYDLALIPYAGWAALTVVALAGLGLAALTRLGSASGWAIEDLRW